MHTQIQKQAQTLNTRKLWNTHLPEKPLRYTDTQIQIHTDTETQTPDTQIQLHIGKETQRNTKTPDTDLLGTALSGGVPVTPGSHVEECVMKAVSATVCHHDKP